MRRNTVLSWTTNNRLVATVNNGLVTSVGKGECLIKVKSRSGAFAECAITVEITLVGLSFSRREQQVGERIYYATRTYRYAGECYLSFDLYQFRHV